MISVGIASKRTCRLPTRPSVQVLVGGRTAAVRRSAFPLGAEEAPRRVIGPGRSVWALVRFENWCRAAGRVALRLRLGGVAVVQAVPGGGSPVCQSRTAPAHVGVSVFVRR
jgi:hypothetical protein